MNDNHDNCTTILPTRAAAISLLHYYATWSLPCRRQCLILHELQRECRQPLEILPVDVEVFPHIAESSAIQSIPTIAVVSHGRERRRLVGLQPLEDLRRIVAEAAQAALADENMYRAATLSSSHITQEFTHEQS